MSKVSLISIPTCYNPGVYVGGAYIEKNEGIWSIRAEYEKSGKVLCYSKEFSIQKHPEFGGKVADYVNKVKHEKMFTALKWVGNCIFGAAILGAIVGLPLVVTPQVFIFCILPHLLPISLFPPLYGAGIVQSSKQQKATDLWELKEYMRTNIFDHTQNLECERDLTKEEIDLMNWKDPITRWLEKQFRSRPRFAHDQMRYVEFDTTRPFPCLRGGLPPHAEPQKRLYPIVPPCTAKAFTYS